MCTSQQIIIRLLLFKRDLSKMKKIEQKQKYNLQH